jgi:hypothetical protein
MKRKNFDKWLKGRLEDIQEKLGTKGNEYATEDQFYNFNQGAKELDTSPEFYLLSLQRKHLISIKQMVMDESFGKYDVWTEKIMDSICYDLLLLGMIFERTYIKMEDK